ncbi:hypothetical protein BCR32DRAFT_240506 [Anaeromyces robustus]|uniref:Uncharacterized protein n=1 Tax=Anaeromyces robustus TaxID=1754192 RepID=A0A1Y1XN17_9FUNG|nr:hypothetical protein BCR32DRAFT_240506 [Anaeromyces robustus]|eukprot:ORX87065.1 hypothetical protein BCR32DRAFT_240506 [Anaeromyces robustus]
MDSNLNFKFPVKYNQMLYESLNIPKNENILNKDIINQRSNSKIYQNHTPSIIYKKSKTFQKNNCKNMLSTDKIVDILNDNSNKKIDSLKKDTKIFKNNTPLHIPKQVSIKKLIDLDCKTYNGDNKNNIYNNVKSNFVDIIPNDCEINDNNKRINSYNIDSKIPNDEKRIKKKKKCKMDHPNTGIDIEFPIIRNSFFSNNENNVFKINSNDKDYKKELLMNVEIFSKKLIDEKEMNNFLKSSKQNEEYTNNLSILDNVILNDMKKKIITKIDNNEILNNELIEANTRTNGHQNN